MNIVTPFVANTKSSKLVQPRQSAFYHPAVASQSAAMLCTPFTNQRDNRTRPQLATMRFRIISTCSCHWRKYRQQLIPAPHPSSCGSISQGIPLRNTYRIPIRARRRSMGLRPGFRYLRGLGSGSNGSISFHTLESLITFGTASNI